MPAVTTRRRTVDPHLSRRRRPCHSAEQPRAGATRGSRRRAPTRQGGHGTRKEHSRAAPERACAPSEHDPRRRHRATCADRSCSDRPSPSRCRRTCRRWAEPAAPCRPRRSSGSDWRTTSTALSFGGRRQQRLRYVEDSIAGAVLGEHEDCSTACTTCPASTSRETDHPVHPGSEVGVGQLLLDGFGGPLERLDLGPRGVEAFLRLIEARARRVARADEAPLAVEGGFRLLFQCTAPRLVLPARWRRPPAARRGQASQGPDRR